jgi:hypothetical protein
MGECLKKTIWNYRETEGRMGGARPAEAAEKEVTGEWEANARTCPKGSKLTFNEADAETMSGDAWETV